MCVWGGVGVCLVLFLFFVVVVVFASNWSSWEPCWFVLHQRREEFFGS